MKHIYLYLLVIFAIPGILFAGEQEWIPLSSYDESPVEVNVTQASDNLIEITYKLAGFTKNELEIDGESYSLIGLPGEPVFLEKGLPELPKINRSVLIPARAKMVAKVTHYEVEEFHNINVAPSKGNLPRSVNPDDIPYWFETFYSTDSWFPEEITITHDPYILRDARGMVVEVHPFQYNPIQKVLRVYKNITVQIENVGIDNINVLDIPLKDKESVVKDFLTIYERRFINFPSLRYELVPEVGTMLIITADEYYDEIVPLVNWKLQKGIPTVVKTISEIGGNNQTNIQNEIQYQYDNNNLAFVLLVGDADDVAPKNVKYDPLYVLLDGNDHYPDAFISRFCANYPSDVANQVNRSIRYERDVAELGGDWYSKGVGIASSQGPGDDGEYDYQHLRNIRTLLLNYNYILVDELYDGSQGGADAPGNPTPTDVANSVNAGRSFINYTGHGSQTSWGSSGFSNSNIDQLSNGFMMPFIFSVACYNGEFHTGECFGEHWLKAGTTDNPRGAIAFYGSTISQSWNPPMEAQDECTDLLVSETALTFGGLCFNGACSMMDQYGYNGQSEYDAWTIFGDASIQIRTLTGEEMTVIHNPIIPLGSTTYDVEVVDVEEALVSLYMNGELYGYGYTDENGEVTIELIEDLTEPGIMTLTVTAYNKIPYIVELDAIVPVQVILSPDTIQVNQQIEIQVTVLDNEGVEPEVGVNVWAKGLGYETDPEVTDEDGIATLSVDYEFGPYLHILGQREGENYLLFDEILNVIAEDLTNPDLTVATEVGLTDTFAMNLPGTIHAECEEEEITLWARLNQGDYISTTDDSLEFTPDNVGNVQAIISKSGYNLYEEIYPVIIAYGTVAGTVTSTEGDPLSEVEVRFYNAGAIPDSTEPIAMAETNSSGIYEVSEELPVNYYDIYIEEFGFMPYQELNYFLAYGENEHDIMLEPSPQITFHGRIYDENGPVTGSKIVYSLSDTGEPYDTVDVPMSRYSASLPIFTYDVYVSCPGHVPFRGELEVNAELLSVDYELGIAALFSDFEEDDGEFSPTPSTNAWEWGEPTAGGISAYSGVNLWATNLEGYYANNADWYLDSPSFTVPDSGRLYFYHYYNFEGSKGEKILWDGGNVKLSVNGGPFTLITPVGGYDGIISGLGEPGFGGTSDGWEQAEFDLEDYAGQEVILRWHFGSDTSINNYYGWYIDDVLVGDPTNSSQYANYNPYSVPSEPQSENIFALYQNYPNPVADQTTIRFALPTNIHKAELSIYNIKGQLVKRFELDSGSKEPVKWDTTDMQGKSVANGIYFYKLSTEKAEAVKKMIVIR